MFMQQSGIIENKVEKSGLITLDLAKFYPTIPIIEFDIAPFLFHGLMLKEKEYREKLSEVNWSDFQGKVIATFCSTDAILQPWAFMLVVQHAKAYAERVIKGTANEVQTQLLLEALLGHDWSHYANKRVLVKGCGDKVITDAFYALAAEKLIEAGAERVMYGEACSFVPIYRKPK